MKVPELKALAKERGLRRYSKLRKAELIALLTPPARSGPAPFSLFSNKCFLHCHQLLHVAFIQVFSVNLV